MTIEDKPLSSPGIRIGIPPRIFILCAAIAGALEWYLFREIGFLPFLSPWLRFCIGGVIGTLGFAFMMGAWFHFIFIGTTVKTAEPASMLVENGTYRFSRNPMYVGFVTLLIAPAIILDSIPFLSASLVMFLYLDRHVIKREERYMSDEFGKAYSDYCAKVRRWL